VKTTANAKINKINQKVKRFFKISLPKAKRKNPRKSLRKMVRISLSPNTRKKTLFKKFKLLKNNKPL
jgi:hypothetical protein